MSEDAGSAEGDAEDSHSSRANQHERGAAGQGALEHELIVVHRTRDLGVVEGRTDEDGPFSFLDGKTDPEVLGLGVAQRVVMRVLDERAEGDDGVVVLLLPVAGGDLGRSAGVTRDLVGELLFGARSVRRVVGDRDAGVSLLDGVLHAHEGELLLRDVGLENRGFRGLDVLGVGAVAVVVVATATGDDEGNRHEGDPEGANRVEQLLHGVPPWRTVQIIDLVNLHSERR